MNSGFDGMVRQGQTAHDSSVQVPPHWQDRLRQVAGRLDAIAGATEAEFLAAGEKLHDFCLRTDEISRFSMAVSDLVAGLEVNGAITGLRETLERMNGYLNRSDGDSGRNSATLANILALLLQVAQPLAGFTKIHKVLRLLGISIKIESARLGESAAGFDTLADDVALLSLQVKEKAFSILEQNAELSGSVNRTLNLLREIGAAQHDGVQSTMDRASDSLETMGSIIAMCGDTACQVSSSSLEVSQNIGEVVTSMQFHDIVRQQVEHVRDSLEELCCRLQPADAALGRPGETIVEVYDVCAVQSAQLGHARSELVLAVERIAGNLRGIAQEQVRVSEITREIVGNPDRAEASSFRKMEEGLSVVTDLLLRSAAGNRHLLATVSTLADTVGAISNFVSDIELIGEEIELIALNAQIKAARTGTTGAALGVLAEAVQRLSLDARKQTETVSSSLMTVAAEAGTLCADVEARATTLESEVEGMAEKVGGMLQIIHRVHGELNLLLEKIDVTVFTLSRDIEATSVGISAQADVATVLDEVRGELDVMVAEARRLVPGCDRAPGGERLRSLSGRYTMQSERLVHESVAGSCSATALAGAALGLDLLAEHSPDASGLGDNVEFF